MDFIRTLLEQQPLMALFLTIAIGYVVGEINIKGFSLGVGAVLFVALGMGWFAPKSAPPAMLGNFGLALFLYAVGIQYGKQFFIGLTSAHGLKANLMALIGVLVAGAISLLFIKTGGSQAPGTRSACSRARARPRRRCRRRSRRSATTTPRWATRSPTRSAWPGPSCSCTSPSVS